MSARLRGFEPHNAGERQRRKRARDRDAGKQAASNSLFDIGQFIAIDGEGFNDGPELEFRVKSSERVYRGHKHEYALLSASDGAEIYSPDRLTTPECLDFLIDRAASNQAAILVCFGASYDMTQMLCHDLTRDEIALLLHGDGRRWARNYVDVTFGDYDYRLELRQRKSLTIWRWTKGADKYVRHVKRDGSRVWRMSPHQRCILWDVWGFFQGTFVGALDTWMPADPDYQFIKRMKGERSVFERSELDTIRKYNAAELRCLAAMMDKVRDALRGMGLKITRWDGAGAIAGALFKHHKVKEHMAPSPPEVFEAAKHAYSGGHIEMIKIGYHSGKVHHYDINSAYPHQFRNLPSLAHGGWEHGTDDAPPTGFTLVKVAYRFNAGLPFYPLFYRKDNGTILYPERGSGWYWYPEFRVAQQFVAVMGAIEFTIIEWWHFESGSNEAPFGWIGEYYARRQQLVKESQQSGIPNGEEKTIKLGLNSCYGKTAQQVGARLEDGEIVPPAYFQIEWAGYVTSGCRAEIMVAAMDNPHAIIGFATDGLFSTEPLALALDNAKTLGGWDYQTHDGITMVMPGVYWLHDGEKTKHYSRGFDKKDMREAGKIHKAWQRKQTSLDVRLTRLITMGSALASDTFWEMRGMFITGNRALALDGDNSKRHSVAMHNAKLHTRLVTTHAQDLDEDYWQSLDTLMSAAYRVGFLEPDAIEADEEMASGEPALADRAFTLDVAAAYFA